MSKIHILKNTETEAVVKVYTTEQPDTIDFDLNTWLTKSTQQWVAPTSIPTEDGTFLNYTGSRVYIAGIYWGLKAGKQLDIQRIIDPVAGTVHNHYYLINAGFYDFTTAGGFTDRIYPNKNIRFVFDGPGHCIVKLRKEGWVPKIETAVFGIYDNVNAVGS